MALALELGLDRAADEAVRRVWAALERQGIESLVSHIPSIRPHMTLLVSEDADGLRACADELRSQIRSLPVELVGPGLFAAEPAILYLSVAPTAALLDLHARVAAALADAAVELWPHYRPGRWMPHCTLSMGVARERLADAVAACLDGPLPIPAGLGDARLTDSLTGATSPL
jgi:2'-5' RNA ligase